MQQRTRFAPRRLLATLGLVLAFSLPESASAGEDGGSKAGLRSRTAADGQLVRIIIQEDQRNSAPRAVLQLPLFTGVDDGSHPWSQAEYGSGSESRRDECKARVRRNASDPARAIDLVLECGFRSGASESTRFEINVVHRLAKRKPTRVAHFETRDRANLDIRVEIE